MIDENNTELKAQSEVIGMVLLLSISVLVISIIAVSGYPVLQDGKNSVQFDRAINEMANLDSNVAEVALGGTSSKSFDMNLEGMDVTVDNDSATINVTHRYPTGVHSNYTVHSSDIGTIELEHDRGIIAYEGGGVWYRRGNDSIMYSSPELHYEVETLTLPMVNITNNADFASNTRSDFEVNIEDTGDLKFRRNPLEEGVVYIEVQSRYYKSWAKYFRERTVSEIHKVDDTENTVTVQLIVPTELGFDYLDDGVLTASDFVPFHGGPPGSSRLDSDEYQEGVELPNVDSWIDSKVNEISSNNDNSGTCISDTGVSGSCGMIPQGEYYIGNDIELNTDMEFDASSGNTTLVIDGDVDFKNDIDINGGADRYSLNLIVTGDVGLGGSTKVGNTEGPDPTDLTMWVRSNGDIGSSSAWGNGDFAGIIYAPESSVQIQGSASVYGTILADVVELENNAITYEPPTSPLDFGLPDVEDDTVQYLYITENKIEVTG